DVEAGAAEGLVLLDHGHLHAELRRADGADIAAGTGADDDEIVGRIGHHIYPDWRGQCLKAPCRHKLKWRAQLIWERAPRLAIIHMSWQPCCCRWLRPAPPPSRNLRCRTRLTHSAPR